MITIRTQSKKADITIQIGRKFTFLRGNSATGKTTFWHELNKAFNRRPGVKLSSTNNIAVIPMAYAAYPYALEQSNQVLVFEEGFPDLKKKEFAVQCKKSDNYFVIIKRDDLPHIPYSYQAILELYGEPSMIRAEQIYFENEYSSLRIKPSRYITEDSKAGFTALSSYFKQQNVITSNGNSNIKDVMKQGDSILADGEAFGSYIKRILDKEYLFDLKLPRSFEYLILTSGVVPLTEEQREVVRNPQPHIDKTKHQTWEQFYTFYLQEITKGTHYEYSKRVLMPYYASEENLKRIFDPLYNPHGLTESTVFEGKD